MEKKYLLMSCLNNQDPAKPETHRIIGMYESEAIAKKRLSHRIRWELRYNGKVHAFYYVDVMPGKDGKKVW